jgi:hypothetical protein
LRFSVPRRNLSATAPTQSAETSITAPTTCKTELFNPTFEVRVDSCMHVPCTSERGPLFKTLPSQKTLVYFSSPSFLLSESHGSSRFQPNPSFRTNPNKPEPKS